MPEGRSKVELLQNRWASAAIGLVGGQILGRAIGAGLSSRAGDRVMMRLGGYPLTPLERRVLAQRWSGSFGNAFSAAAAALIITRRQGPTDEHVIKTGAMPGTVAGVMAGRKIDWVQVVQRSGEIMLAFGAIFRVLGEYLEDRQRVAKEDERDIAQRL
jgi:hypothetical protein